MLAFNPLSLFIITTSLVTSAQGGLILDHKTMELEKLEKPESYFSIIKQALGFGSEINDILDKGANDDITDVAFDENKYHEEYDDDDGFAKQNKYRDSNSNSNSGRASASGLL